MVEAGSRTESLLDQVAQALAFRGIDRAVDIGDVDQQGGGRETVIVLRETAISVQLPDRIGDECPQALEHRISGSAGR